MSLIIAITNLNNGYPLIELVISINRSELLISIIPISDIHNSPERL